MSEKQTIDKEENNVDIEQKVYELGYLINPSLDSAQVSEAVSNLEKEISKISNEIITSADPELIDLAYTIKVNVGGRYDKYDNAYFGWIKFVANPQDLESLKEELSFNKDLIRYILIKTVREDTRAQLEQEAIKKLDEAKKVTSDDIKSAEQDELSDEEIDKVVEELLAKIDDDIDDEVEQDKKEQDTENKENKKA